MRNAANERSSNVRDEFIILTNLIKRKSYVILCIWKYSNEYIEITESEMRHAYGRECNEFACNFREESLLFHDDLEVISMTYERNHERPALDV